MLKTATVGARCFTTKTPKASYLHSTCRLLHSETDVSRPSQTFSTVHRVEVEDRSSKTEKRTTTGKIRRLMEAVGPIDKIRPISPPSSSTHSELTEAQTAKRPGSRKTKNTSPFKKIIFKNSLAAQRAVRPAVQAARVKEICLLEGVEEAINFVTTAPRDTLNAIVWNTLLWELMKAGRRKRAYEMYTEMKRRGFTPGARTFLTMLNGMDTIPAHEWHSNQENLERCHKLYDALDSYRKTVEDSGSSLESSEEYPYLSFARAAYIRILGKTGNFQKIVDLFYMSDVTGPFARDKYVYSALFSGLLNRKEAERLGTLSVVEQNASDAKFYWRTLERDLERGMEIDSYVVTPFIKLMASGRPVDQQFGWNVVRDLFGLVPPGEDSPTPRLPLCNFSFHAVLELCNKSKKFRLCTYFMKQVTDQLRLKLRTVSNLMIGYRHVNEQLIALGQLAAVGSFDESARAVEAIRYLKRAAALESQKPAPRSSLDDVSLQAETVTLALGVCWRCGDWERATEIFSLATDIPAENFADDGPTASGTDKPNRPPSLRMKLLYTSGFTHMARTALSTENKANIRQCLRMLGAYGADVYPIEPSRNFYKIELAKATIKLVDTASAGWTKDEVRIWKAMKKDSLQVLSKRIPIERPDREDDGLGSEKYIGKLQQAIDFELSTRGT